MTMIDAQQTRRGEDGGGSMRPTGPVYAILESFLTDTETPIGRRLDAARNIRKAAETVERRLTLQLGVDFAKHLFANGIEPSGRPVGETLAALANDTRKDQAP